MRLMPSFHLSYADVSAARVALAAGAVAGLIVIAACTDSASKAVTAPPAIRAATIGSGGFGTAKILRLCVDASSPAGTYTFRNIALNRSFAQDSWSNALDGNGFFDGTFWSDQGDGGDGTTTANALVNVDYTVSPGGCVDVLTRSVGDAAFMAKLPNTDPSGLGQCDPGTQSCGGVNDAFAAANILFVSASNGYVYDHTDCEVDEGALMPQHITSAVGNPSPWPAGGFNSLDPAFATYGCGSDNNPTRGFANFEHGETLTLFVHAPPVLSDCTLGYPDNSNNPRSSAVFNESSVLTGFALISSVLHAWTTDEHAMTIGVDSIFINNKNPTPDQYFGISNFPADYAIAKMVGNMTSATTAGVTGSPFVKVGRIGTSSPPVGLGNAVDPAGRPLRPGIYLTDLTANGSTSRAGDWQQGNDNPIVPTALFGTWKGAVLTINNTTNPPGAVTITPRADPAKNHKVVGPGGTNPPLAAQDLGYSTDVQWALANLGLISGHAYRAQVIVHDGDQNKTGGDVGQACINIQN